MASALPFLPRFTPMLGIASSTTLAAAETGAFAVARFVALEVASGAGAATACGATFFAVFAAVTGFAAVVTFAAGAGWDDVLEGFFAVEGAFATAVAGETPCVVFAAGADVDAFAVCAVGADLAACVTFAASAAVADGAALARVAIGAVFAAVALTFARACVVLRGVRLRS